MKVGVTGASGFIGRHVVKALQKRGDEVIGIVRDPKALSGCQTRVADLSHPSKLDGVLEGLEGVIHLAAHLPKSYADPEEARTCLEVNALGTLALLRACGPQSVPRAIVFSGNIYRPGTTPMSEDGPIAPSSQAPYYLISKACADFYAEAIAREGRLGVTILRPAAVYGPGLNRGMIPTFVTKLAAGERVTIQDGGRYRADLVYVEDVADAAAAAVHAPVHGTFNVGSGTVSSVLEIAQALALQLRASPDLIDVRPAVDRPPGAGGEITGFSPLDIGRARASLGYRPRDLRSGLAGYLSWWREQC